MDRYTDGKVTKPINVADLSQLLNRSQEDINKVEYSNLLTSVGGLCTHPNINKWAKYKPIKHHTISNITEEQRKDRKGNGELYGVIVTGGNVIERLHDVRFTYVRPEGGSNSPYRLGDFFGYNHKAKPSVSGQMNWNGEKGAGYICTDGNDNINVHIDVNNVPENSIRLEDFLPSDADGNNIADFYPVAVIGTWAIVMRHKDGFGNYNIRKLSENMMVYSDFTADLNSYIPDDANNFPQMSGEKYPLSIGLIKQYKQEGIFDLTKWTDISLGHIIDSPVLGVPGSKDGALCGIQVTLYSEFDKYRVRLSFFVGDVGFSVNITPIHKDEFEGLTDVKLTVRFSQDGSFAVTKTISVNKPSGDFVEINTVPFTWSEFSLFGAPLGNFELYATAVYRGYTIGSALYNGSL